MARMRLESGCGRKPGASAITLMMVTFASSTRKTPSSLSSRSAARKVTARPAALRNRGARCRRSSWHWRRLVPIRHAPPQNPHRSSPGSDHVPLSACLISELLRLIVCRSNCHPVRNPPDRWRRARNPLPSMVNLSQRRKLHESADPGDGWRMCHAAGKMACQQTAANMRTTLTSNLAFGRDDQKTGHVRTCQRPTTSAFAKFRSRLRTHATRATATHAVRSPAGARLSQSQPRSDHLLRSARSLRHVGSWCKRRLSEVALAGSSIMVLESSVVYEYVTPSI